MGFRPLGFRRTWVILRPYLQQIGDLGGCLGDQFENSALPLLQHQLPGLPKLTEDDILIFARPDHLLAMKIHRPMLDLSRLHRTRRHLKCSPDSLAKCSTAYKYEEILGEVDGWQQQYSPADWENATAGGDHDEDQGEDAKTSRRRDEEVNMC